MCPELFLVSFYFIILFLINFLLFELVQSDYKKILFFQKFQKVLAVSKQKKLKNFSFYYFFSKYKKKNTDILIKMNPCLFLAKDFFLLGNLYQLLSENKELSVSKRYYFELLKTQIFFRITKSGLPGN